MEGPGERDIDWLRRALAPRFDEVSLVGTSREHRGGGRSRVQAIWKQGRLLRVEDPPGMLDTVLGVNDVWYRWRETGKVVMQERIGDENPYTHPALLVPRPAEVWATALAQDSEAVIRSVQTRVLHGRQAVSCTLPAKQGRRLSLTVDEATGLWLEALVDDRPWLAWDELRIGVSIDSARFVGPG